MDEAKTPPESSPVLRILFVDDDPNVLAALRQKLHTLKGEWAMTFARGGQEALALLRQSEQDVVVSSTPLPEVDEGNALPEGPGHWPSVVRVILSGQSDEESSLGSLGSSAPDGACNPAVLRSTVQRAVALHRLIQDERVRVVVARMDSLPSAPVMLHELMAELSKEECSLIRVGQIVGHDVAMTAKILRLVNSAYFGFRCKISDPILAVRFLGINTVCSLVMACHIFQQADPSLASWLGLNQIWHHSLLTSQWAKRIAESETNDRNIVDDALAAGMLHDSGRLVLAINFPETYRSLVDHARMTREDLLGLEQAVLGVSHAEVGAYLMGTWGLRSPIVEAIAYHHAPGGCVHRGFSPLTAVHAACAMEKEGATRGDPHACGGLDRDYFAANGFQDRLDLWRGLCEDVPAAESLILD